MLAAEVMIGVTGLILALAIVFVAFELFKDESIESYARRISTHLLPNEDLYQWKHHTHSAPSSEHYTRAPTPAEEMINVLTPVAATGEWLDRKCGLGDYDPIYGPVTPASRDLMTAIEQAVETDRLARFAACWPDFPKAYPNFPCVRIPVVNPYAVVKNDQI
jgi:hypothetical protein